MSNAVSINNSVLMGRLTRAPELRYVNGNIPIYSFKLAVARHTSGDEGKTDFIPCVAWREKAEFVSQWFSKGTLAIVIGELTSHVWKEDVYKRQPQCAAQRNVKGLYRRTLYRGPTCL